MRLWECHLESVGPSRMRLDDETSVAFAANFYGNKEPPQNLVKGEYEDLSSCNAT